MMEEKLTKLQSFNAMRKFLEIYYKQTSSDDFGTLLSDTQFLSDCGTADPAAWYDWINSVNSVITTEEKLTKQQAYNATIKFLEVFYERTKSDAVRVLLNEMDFLADGRLAHPAVLNYWNKCVEATLKEPEDHKEYLTFVSTDKKL